jgi:hypothetical protein
VAHPFDYAFEADCDLHPSINGKEYEFDFPYNQTVKRKPIKRNNWIEQNLENTASTTRCYSSA